jgi:hypothetical protein
VANHKHTAEQIEANRAKRRAQQAVEIRAYTIGQWCRMRGYSRVYFYTLKKTGDAPLLIGSGKRQRVSAEADQRWLAQQEKKAAKRRAAS